MATDKADVNNIYEEALSNLKTRKPAFSKNTAMSNSEKDQAAKDYYANVRTNVSFHRLRGHTVDVLKVLLAWVLSNVRLFKLSGSSS